MNKKITLLLTFVMFFICTNKSQAKTYTASGTTFTGLSKNCATKNCEYDNTNRLILQARLYYIDQGSFTQIGHTVYLADSNTYNLLKDTGLYLINKPAFDSLLTNNDKYEEAKKKVSVGDVNTNGKTLFKMITGMENYEDILRKESNPYPGNKGYRLVYEPAFIVINPTFGTDKYGLITTRGKMIEKISGRSSALNISKEEYKMRNRSDDVGIPGRVEKDCKNAVDIKFADLQFGCGYRMMDVSHYASKDCYNRTTSNSGNTTCINYDENNVSKYSELYTKTSSCTTANKNNTKYGSYTSNNGTCKMYCKEEALVSLPGNISNPQLRGSYFAWPTTEENSLYKMSIKSYMKCTILDEGGEANRIASNVTTKCPDGYTSHSATICRAKSSTIQAKCPADYPLEYNGKCYAGKNACETGWQFVDSYCYKISNATYTDKIVKIKCSGSKVYFDNYCYTVEPAKTKKLADPKDKVCPGGSYSVNGKCYTSQRGRDWHSGNTYYTTCDPCGTHYFGDATYCSKPSSWDPGCDRCGGMTGTAKTECLKTCKPAHAYCTGSGWTPDDNTGVNPACIKKASCSTCGGSLWGDGYCHIKHTSSGYYYCSSGVESGSYCYSNEVSKVCPSDHPIEKDGKCYMEQTVSPYCDSGTGNHINDTNKHTDAEGNNYSLKGTCVSGQENPCPNGKLVKITENGKVKSRCEINCDSGVDDTVNNVKKCVSCVPYATIQNTSSAYHKFTAAWEQKHKHDYEVNSPTGTFNLQGKCTYSPVKPNCDKSTFINGKCKIGTAQNKICDNGYIKIGDICYKTTSKILNYSCPDGYTISNNKLSCTKNCNKETLSTNLESTIKNNKIQAKLTAGDNKKIDENLVIYSDTVEKVDDTNYVRTAKFKINENRNRYFNRITGAVTDSGPASSIIYDRGQGMISLSRSNEILEGSSTKKYSLKISNMKVGTDKKFDIADYTCKFTITENNPPCVCPAGTKNANKKLTEIESSLGIVLEKDLKCAGLIKKYCDYKATSYSCKSTKTGQSISLTTCVENEMKNNKSQLDAYEICKQKQPDCTNDTCVNVKTNATVNIKSCLDEGNSRKVCEEKNGCRKQICVGNCSSTTKTVSGTIYKTTKCNGNEYCNFEVYCLNTSNTSRRATTCVEEQLGTTNIVESLNKNEISTTLLENAIKTCKPVICEKGPIALFRVVDLNHPFPGTTGGDRKPGYNWDDENVIREKITKARNVEGNKLYQKEPLMTITLTPADIKNIRTYNDSVTYTNFTLKCVDNQTASCVSKFLHTKEEINLNIKYNSNCNLNLSSKKEQFDKCYNSNN